MVLEAQTEAEAEAARLAAAQAAAVPEAPAAPPPAATTERPRDAAGRRMAAIESENATMKETLGEMNNTLVDIATFMESAQTPVAGPPPAVPAAGPQVDPVYDPRTGQYVYPQPAAAPQTAPTPQLSVDEIRREVARERLQDEFCDLGDRLVRDCHMLSKEADVLAGEVIQEYSKGSASLNSVMAKKFASSPEIRKILEVDAGALVAQVGGTFTMPEATPALNEDGTPVVTAPATAPGQEGTELVVPAPGTPAAPAGTESQSAAPAVEGGAGTIETMPPPNAEGEATDIAVRVEAARRRSDGRYIAGQGA